MAYDTVWKKGKWPHLLTLLPSLRATSQKLGPVWTQRNARTGRMWKLELSHPNKALFPPTIALQVPISPDQILNTEYPHCERITIGPESGIYLSVLWTVCGGKVQEHLLFLFPTDPGMLTARHSRADGPPQYLLANPLGFSSSRFSLSFFF